MHGIKCVTGRKRRHKIGRMGEREREMSNGLKARRMPTNRERMTVQRRQGGEAARRAARPPCPVCP